MFKFRKDNHVVIVDISAVVKYVDKKSTYTGKRAKRDLITEVFMRFASALHSEGYRTVKTFPLIAVIESFPNLRSSRHRKILANVFGGVK